MHQSMADNSAQSTGSLRKMQDQNATNYHTQRTALRQPAANTQPPSFGFAPPAREPSPGALPALLALALGFAIALALCATTFNTATHTGVHLPSAAGLSQ